MDKADVRLIKLGYFSFDPATMDYWAEVERIRGLFAGWEKLAREYGVKVCYHTHSHRCMGLNCGMLAHLLQGFDPQYLGAYIDPGHMNIEGEEFAVGAAIARPWLSIVALKDSLAFRVETEAGHGRKGAHWLPAGRGTVDWTAVFDELARIGYQGPLTVHCEFEVAPEAFAATFRDEVAFYRRQRDRVVGA
jgi:sugar phosphate isomerase/epimerase